MWIEVGAPCSLLLGIVPTASAGKYSALSVTLQYPPVHLFAQAQRGPLRVTGARAPQVYFAAETFLASHSLNTSAEIEIELATPTAMGLGSDAMLALSAAHALAWMNDLPVDDVSALAGALSLSPLEGTRAWGFQQGGLLEVELEGAAGQPPALIQRKEIAHDHKQAWVFVFHFPHTPRGTSPTLETDRQKALAAVAPRMDREAALAARNALWQAADADDLPAFAAALMSIMEHNRAALAAVGTPFPVTDEDQQLITLLREHGALAWGKTPTGLATFGLVQGGEPSRQLRRHIKDVVGHEGGIVMASVTDNTGVRQSLHEKKPALQGG